MKSFETVLELKSILALHRKAGSRIGFVPTMGALHEGHISLVKRAIDECDICVTSIFVNPTQFDDPDDFAKYPKAIDEDLRKLESSGCHLAFIPPVKEVYPHGQATAPTFDFGQHERILEGAVRPGHFRGMAQVVALLLDIVQPDALFMGQKDYQQYLIVKKLVEERLRMNAQVVLCPIIRETDGLAMSSRNERLSPEQREDAVELSRTLFWIKEQFGVGDPSTIKQAAIERLRKVPSVISVDYVEIADAGTLEPVTDSNRQSSIALAAIRMDSVRLIDNVML